MKKGRYFQMSVFICRWPNGDVSFVDAFDEEHAIELLDEIGNAEGCPLFEVESDFLLHLRLTDDGEFNLDELGDFTQEHFWGGAYPKLIKAVEGSPEEIREAVKQERKRVKLRRRAKAQTEAGRKLQEVADLPSSLADKYIQK